MPRQEFWRRNREEGLPYNYVVIVQDVYEGATNRAKTGAVKAEMRVLRWMSGVTKLDRIRNQIIRGIAKMGELSKMCTKVV